MLHIIRRVLFMPRDDSTILSYYSTNSESASGQWSTVS